MASFSNDSRSHLAIVPSQDFKPSQDSIKHQRPPPPSDPREERETLIHNEKVKLAATWVNSASLAFVVGSGVTTVVGVGALPSPSDQLLRGFIWFMVGAILRFVGRALLGSLR